MEDQPLSKVEIVQGLMIQDAYRLVDLTERVITPCIEREIAKNISCISEKLQIVAKGRGDVGGGQAGA